MRFLLLCAHRFLVSVVFLVILGANVQSRPTITEILPTFEAYVTKAMADWGVPGAAVAIVKDGRIIMAKGFGVKTVGGHDPVGPHTQFPIVSLTKNITAALVAKLVDMGKLSWDDKVTKYYPEFRLQNAVISAEFTIRDLLSHRSGMPEFVADSFTELLWSDAEILKILPSLPMDPATTTENFRHIYGYQNVFVGIAGVIIERVMQKPLSAVYHELLFNPLKMTHTIIGRDGLTGGEGWWTRFKRWCAHWFVDKTDLHHPLPQPLGGDDIMVIPGGNPCIYTFNASRGIQSDITDMAKWLQFQLSGALIDKTVDGAAWISAENLMQTRTFHVDAGTADMRRWARLFPAERVSGKIAYGMGWFIHDYAGVEMLSHMGGMTGVRSLIAIVPKENVGIIVLSNLGGMRVSFFPEALRSKFFDLYLGLSDAHDWSHELLMAKKKTTQNFMAARLKRQLQNPMPAADNKVYEGTYHHALYGDIVISTEKEQIFLAYRGRHAPLTHANAHNFTFVGSSLSPGLAGIDLGDVVFGVEPHQSKAFGLMINIFREGKDLLFERVR